MSQANLVGKLTPIFKIGALGVGAIVLTVLVVGIAAGFYQTRKMERLSNQVKFRGGAPPSPLPDGSLKGAQSTGYGKSWRGKVFDRQGQTGINKFTDGQRYRFKTYLAPGLRDQDKQVLRIDYKQPGNPWWLRFVVDEIVQTDRDHYLGKIHVQVIPGLPFTLGYFELSSK